MENAVGNQLGGAYQERLEERGTLEVGHCALGHVWGCVWGRGGGGGWG